MRTSRAPLALLVALGACVSSGTYVPAPPRPLEITIVRPETGRLLVQTNRRSHIAVFDIVPGRGVALVYPATVHQTMTNGGMQWLPIAWTTPNGIIDRIIRRGAEVHYAYAIASDEPLDITDESYDPTYLQRKLGYAAYRATNVAATMRAIAQHFVPEIPMEQWSEDSYALQDNEQTRVIVVYCGDGMSYEVREAIVARIRCSTRPPVAGSSAPAPREPRVVAGGTYPRPRGDSVVQSGSSSGTITPPRRPPVLLFPTPTGNATDSAVASKPQDRDSSRSRGHVGERPREPHGRGLGQGIGAPRNDPKSPDVGDANPMPDVPRTTTPGNGNGNGSANANGNASGNANGSANGNGNAARHDDDHGKSDGADKASSDTKKDDAAKPAPDPRGKAKGILGRLLSDSASKKTP